MLPRGLKLEEFELDQMHFVPVHSVHAAKTETWNSVCQQKVKTTLSAQFLSHMVWQAISHLGLRWTFPLFDSTSK